MSEARDLLAVVFNRRRQAVAQLSTTLPLRPDAERVRLRLGTAFIEHIDDLWPCGPPPEATPEWIRDTAFDLLATLEQMFVIDDSGCADNLRRIPQRLHWLLWLLDEQTGGTLDPEPGSRKVEDAFAAVVVDESVL